jgi:hypothetical protein
VTTDGKIPPRRPVGYPNPSRRVGRVFPEPEIWPGDWQVTYEDPPGATHLVDDFFNLTLHLEQQPGYDDTAIQPFIDRFAATDLILHAPMTLIADLIGGSYGGLSEALPRKFAGASKSTDNSKTGNDRRIAAINQGGDKCAYCGIYVAETYELSLRFTADHIIPQRMIDHGYRQVWIDDLVNLVACCPECHELDLGFQLDTPAPRTKNGFFDLRDRVFVQRKARIAVRRAEQSDASTR